MYEVIHYTEEDRILYERYHYLFKYEDGKLFRKVSTSNKVKVGDEVGSPHNGGYLQLTVDNRKKLIHHVIYHMFHGHKPKVIDHIDRNKLNNHIENLRGTDYSVNNRNRTKFKGASSKYNGVSWCKYTNRWLVHINIQGKSVHIGRFDSEQDAARAFNTVALREIEKGNMGYNINKIDGE